MKKRKWRRRLFAPEKRRRQAVVAAVASVCVILYLAAEYWSGGLGKYLTADAGQALLELGKEKKPSRKTEYGIHIQWKEGRIIFYQAEEEPYILKEAEPSVIH